MAKIRCKYIDCTFLEDGICSAVSIELDPDEGCLTFTHLGDTFEDDDWEDDEDLDGYEEWDDEDDDILYDDDF